MVCKLQKTVSGSWAGNPNLPFLVCLDVVHKDVKLIDNDLLFSSVFAFEINPRKPKPVGFWNKDSLLTIEHLENDSIRKVHPIGQEA